MNETCNAVLLSTKSLKINCGTWLRQFSICEEWNVVGQLELQQVQLRDERFEGVELCNGSYSCLLYQESCVLSCFNFLGCAGLNRSRLQAPHYQLPLGSDAATKSKIPDGELKLPPSQNHLVISPLCLSSSVCDCFARIGNTPSAPRRRRHSSLSALAH